MKFGSNSVKWIDPESYGFVPPPIDSALAEPFKPGTTSENLMIYKIKLQACQNKRQTVSKKRADNETGFLMLFYYIFVTYSAKFHFSAILN